MTTVTKDDLISALEGSFFIYPEISGMTTRISVPGVSGHYTPISHPEANMVGRAALTPDNADGTIANIQQMFGQMEKSVGWFVGPGTTPVDLPLRLEAAGFNLLVAEAGMALTDLGRPIRSNPEIRVERATVDQCRGAIPMLTRAMDGPEFLLRYLIDYFAALGTRLSVMMYLAYVEDRAEPVAFADSIFLSDLPIVILQGAATLPDHRRRGIYSTLLARRLQDARAVGAEAAVIQAVRTTSAPIVAKLGFEEVCALQLFAWEPGRAT